MEDDKTPASPRKRTAKAKPTDTSKPSATTDSTAAEASRTPRPRKIPPATFVPPAPPSSPATPSQPIADASPPSTAPTAASRQPARKSPTKIVKKAAKKTAAPPPPQDTPAAKGPAAAVPAQPVAKAPIKKAAKKAAPKAAAPKKAAPAAARTPATPPPEITEPTAPAPAPLTTPDPRPVPPAPLWPTIKANPGYAPELLALAAVEHLGPQARTDVTWLRDRYPTATTHGLVRIATSRSVRQARAQGAVAGLLGPLAVLAGAGALLWTQARLVLDIAAAYGRDPADPERAVELLALQRVHPDLAAAREALAAARGAVTNGTGGRDAMQVPLPLVRIAGRALGRMTIARRVARIVPGAGAALTGILDGRATEQLAVRATKFYRG